MRVMFYDTLLSSVHCTLTAQHTKSLHTAYFCVCVCCPWLPKCIPDTHTFIGKGCSVLGMFEGIKHPSNVWLEVWLIFLSCLCLWTLLGSAVHTDSLWQMKRALCVLLNYFLNAIQAYNWYFYQQVLTLLLYFSWRARKKISLAGTERPSLPKTWVKLSEESKQFWLTTIQREDERNLIKPEAGSPNTHASWTIPLTKDSERNTACWNLIMWCVSKRIKRECPSILKTSWSTSTNMFNVKITHVHVYRIDSTRPKKSF